jgi:hypothetical protein
MGFYLMLAAVFIVVWVLPIWYSIKAKPLGPKRYRWGTYVGILTALCTLPIALLGWKVLVNGRPFYIILFLVLVICGLLTSFGILRRRRFGVLLFPLFYLLVIVAGSNQSPGSAGNALGIIVFVVVSSIYFGKRWKFMTLSVVSAAAPSEG